MSFKIVIDFGSSVTNIYKLGSGVVLSEPTVVAVDTDGKNVIKAYGEDAKKMIGKTSSNTKVVFPVFEGEIVNEDIATSLLKYFLKKVEVLEKLSNITAIISVPCGITTSMLDKYRLVMKNVGISKEYYIEAPILAILGQRRSVTESNPCFILDLEGGTTNIAALSLDGIIAGISVNFGLNKVKIDLIDYIAENFGLQIGILTAEKIKNDIGSLDKFDDLATVVNGRDIVTGSPKSISVKASSLFPATEKYYNKVISLANNILKKLPPEVSAEIRRSGVYISGEGANIYGIKEYFSEKLSMPINISNHPDMDVVLGGGLLLSDSDRMKSISLKLK